MKNCTPARSVGRKARSPRHSARKTREGPSGEMADAADSKSAGAQAPCRFESDLGHQVESDVAHSNQTNCWLAGRFESDLGHQVESDLGHSNQTNCWLAGRFESDLGHQVESDVRHSNQTNCWLAVSVRIRPGAPG